jgi:hypothetical protein
MHRHEFRRRFVQLAAPTPANIDFGTQREKRLGDLTAEASADIRPGLYINLVVST